jgi:hypothetical protein
MRVSQAVMLFISFALLAWVGAYGPDIWRRHQAFNALDSKKPHWVCVINGDAVSSQYEGYITKKYIMLGGQRFYSEEFKRWGRAADYMLVVIDENMFMRWTRLDLDETDSLARSYGIAQAGCRRMESRDVATNQVIPVTPPIYNRVYTGPGVRPAVSVGGFGGTVDVGAPASSSSAPASSSFDWKRAVGPAIEPAGKSGAGSSTTPSTGAAPAPSDGGVRP